MLQWRHRHIGPTEMGTLRWFISLGDKKMVMITLHGASKQKQRTYETKERNEREQPVSELNI